MQRCRKTKRSHRVIVPHPWKRNKVYKVLALFPTFQCLPIFTTKGGGGENRQHTADTLHIRHIRTSSSLLVSFETWDVEHRVN